METADRNRLLSIRGVLPVVLVALAAAIANAAMAIVEQVSLQSGGEPLGPLAQVTLPIFWVAGLNKILLPVAIEMLRDPNVDQQTAAVKAACALIGIGFGNLSGLSILLLAYGRSVAQRGGAFSVSLLRYLDWALLTICAIFGLISVWYVFQFRQFLGRPLLALGLPIAFGCFLLSLASYILLSVVIYWCYQVGHDALRNWQRKKWQ